MNRLLCCLALMLSLSACANLDKKPKFTLTFHTQGSEMDSPRSIFPYLIPDQGKKVAIKWIPEISHKNVAAFQPFKADDGKTNGVTLRLDARGTNALSITSRMQQGGVIVALLNGRPIDHLVLDRPTDAGIITVWQGIPDEVIALMKKQFPPIKDLRSSSNAHSDMLPTTEAEKKRSLKQSQEMEKQAAKDAAAKAKNPEKKTGEQQPELPKRNDLDARFDPAQPQLPRSLGLPQSAPATVEPGLRAVPIRP